MNVQQFFNIVLLALSVATILLTIVSYLLYRVRQMPGAVGKPKEIIRTQGAFFKRYLPKELADANLVASGEASPIGIPRRIVPFFGIFACVIFIALFVSLMMGSPNKVSAPINSANAFKELHAKGLLKDYEVTSNDLTHVAEEMITPHQVQKLNELMSALKNKKILLVDFSLIPPKELKKLPVKKVKHALPVETPPAETPVAEAAVAGWRTFMTAHQFNFELTNKVDCSSHPDLVLIPQAHQLSEAAKAGLAACLDLKVSVLATGPVDTIAAVPDAANTIGERVFGLRFSAVGVQANELTTVFRDGHMPTWDLPAGLILNWAMLDSSFKATTIHGEGAAFETLGNGFATPYVRASFLEDSGSRRAWLAFDPSKEKSVVAAERFYRRVALASTLAWATRLPTARAETWPAGNTSALLVSVDSEDKFENVAALQKAFDKAPATFFLVSNLFVSHPDAFKNTDKFELASHSENHGIFTGQPLAEQFDRIQTSRHEIEEISAQRVRGFRAPEEKYDDATISAVVQNHLDFFAVDRRFLRFSPIAVGGGSTLLFPRLTVDDFGLSRRGDLKTADGFLTVIAEDADQVLKVGGMNLLNMHTQLTGANPEMLEGIKKAIPALQSRGFWVATFSQATSWWRARNQVDLSVEAGTAPGAYTVRVTNPGRESIDELVVDVDLGLSPVADSGTESHVTEQTVTANRAVAQAQKFTNTINVGHLQPNETRIFAIDAAIDGAFKAAPGQTEPSH